MRSIQSKAVVAVAVLAVVGLVRPVEAGFGGKLARGLSLVDFRFSGERNLFGDGFTINTAAQWNNREFDMGFSELTLTGTLGASAGFTRRGIPKFEFVMNTPQPLAYRYEVNTGAQDFVANGRVLINIDTEINQFGFYDQVVHISNRGDYESDGYLVRDSGTLDMDVGPINVSGNVFLDALAVATSPFLGDASENNLFAKLSGRAQKQAVLEAQTAVLQAKLDAGETLSDAELTELINNSVLTAILSGSSADHLFDGLIAPDSFLVGPPLSAGTTSMLHGGSGTAVPEPTTLALLALGGLTLMPLRRRRRDR